MNNPPVSRFPYRYSGALHIHSVFSDGSGEVSEIAAAATETDLDFIILTDHNTTRALHEGYERFYRNTLLIAGCEINDRENKNHYLALGIKEPPSTRLPAQEYVKCVKQQGGIGFLAHPHEKRFAFPQHPPYPWTEWASSDFTGIEIWNHMSEWMENLTEQNKYSSFIHPLKTISAPPAETLAIWDRLNLERLVVGVGGIDAHAHKINFLGFFELEVFPYKVLFKSIRTSIFLSSPLRIGNSPEEIAEAKRAVLNALEKGECFVTNSYHGDARAFQFMILSGERIIEQGETAPFGEGMRAYVSIPEPADIRLYCNGIKCGEVTGCSADFPITQSGVFRVEVYKEKKAWILSNPIRIGI